MRHIAIRNCAHACNATSDTKRAKRWLAPMGVREGIGLRVEFVESVGGFKSKAVFVDGSSGIRAASTRESCTSSWHHPYRYNGTYRSVASFVMKIIKLHLVLSL